MHWIMCENYEYLVLTSVVDPGFSGQGDNNSKDGEPNYYLANLPMQCFSKKKAKAFDFTA